jgi:hypothetical protein
LIILGALFLAETFFTVEFFAATFFAGALGDVGFAVRARVVSISAFNSALS